MPNLCERCRSEYERLYMIAKAEGYKAGFHEGFAVFQKEIALANARRPIEIHLHRPLPKQDEEKK